MATTGHFRSLLDAEQDQLATYKSARDNLSGLAQEQGKALGNLVLAANFRQAAAEQAVSEAKVSADLDYVAANRLQQERTGGDQCTAAISIIDRSLAYDAGAEFTELWGRNGHVRGCEPHNSWTVLWERGGAGADSARVRRADGAAGAVRARRGAEIT